MAYVIVHRYEIPNFKTIGKVPPESEERCEFCLFSEKTRLLGNSEDIGLHCNARLFDTKTLQCFVPDYRKLAGEPGRLEVTSECTDNL